MKRFWLRTVLLGLVLGPFVPLDVSPLPPREEESAGDRGHVARGAGFYVWAEDAREAEAWARELRHASRTHEATRRGRKAEPGPARRGAARPEPPEGPA